MARQETTEMLVKLRKWIPYINLPRIAVTVGVTPKTIMNIATEATKPRKQETLIAIYNESRAEFIAFKKEVNAIETGRKKRKTKAA